MYKIRKPIRLVGVRIDNLIDKEEKQISLFQNKNSEKQEKLDKVIDSLKEKYGYQSITRAGKLEIGNKMKFKE